MSNSNAALVGANNSVIDPVLETVRVIRKPEKEHEGKAIMAALIANAAIALMKFLVAMWSKSAAMLSESIHSASDTANEITLILGKKFSKKRRTRKHPFGTSRGRYLASFLVATLLFVLGGVYSTMEAFKKVISIIHGGPDAHSIDTNHLLIVLGVCVVSFCLEAWSLHNSIKEAKERFSYTHSDTGKEFDLWRFWTGTKSSDLIAVIAEDVLACTGLVFAFIGTLLALITGDDIWDAIGGAAVGILLIGGAVLLGIQISSLLLGEGASDATYDRIEKATNLVLARKMNEEGTAFIIKENENGVKYYEHDSKNGNRIIRVGAVHLDEDSLQIVMKIDLADSANIDDTVYINAIESEIRREVPWYEFEISVEVDHYDPTRDDPSTDVA